MGGGLSTGVWEKRDRFEYSKMYTLYLIYGRETSIVVKVQRSAFTSMGSTSLAMEGDRERDLSWDLESSLLDGVLEGVKLSTESTWKKG